MYMNSPIERAIDLIKSKDWKDVDFYSKLSISSQTWTNWKKRGIPAKDIDRVAAVLNTTPDYLKYGTAQKGFTNNLQSGSSTELSIAVDSQSPVNLKGSLSIETAIILVRIIHEGLGVERFQSMTEDAQKQVVRVIATWDFTGNKDHSQLIEIVKALHSN